MRLMHNVLNEEAFYKILSEPDFLPDWISQTTASPGPIPLTAKPNTELE